MDTTGRSNIDVSSYRVVWQGKGYELHDSPYANTAWQPLDPFTLRGTPQNYNDFWVSPDMAWRVSNGDIVTMRVVDDSCPTCGGGPEVDYTIISPNI